MKDLDIKCVRPCRCVRRQSASCRGAERIDKVGIAGRVVPWKVSLAVTVGLETQQLMQTSR